MWIKALNMNVSIDLTSMFTFRELVQFASEKELSEIVEYCSENNLENKYKIAKYALETWKN